MIMNWLALLLIFVTNAIAFEQQFLTEQNRLAKVAIIGAGAAGASAAYHLANFTDGNVEITVYESNNYIGGRTHTIDIEGLTFELGASIYDDANSILKNAAEEFNLNTTDGVKLIPDDQQDEVSLGIWDGRDFQFELNKGGKLSTYWQIFKRFGWRAPRRAGKLREEAVSRFLKLYDEQFPWNNLGEAAAAIGIDAYTNVTAAEYFFDHDIDQDFANNFIQALTRVNYSLDLVHIHALAALVSLEAMNNVYSIQGGNWQIFEGMVNKSKAEVRLDTTVSAVIYDPVTNKWNVASSESDEEFDYVVLAAPAQYSNIRFVPDIEVAHVDYISLYSTYVVTDKPLDASAKFGSSKTYNSILTIPNHESGEAVTFTSVSHNAVTKAGNHIYKVFSFEEPTDHYLSDIFGNVTILDKIGTLWHSYPNTRPIYDEYPNVELLHNLFYTSSIDAFISTMETNALSGKNVARLIADGIAHKKPADNN